VSVAFADTSAVVKLYAREVGSTEVRIAEADRGFVISGLARVEVPSALWRKAREGAVDMTDARILTNTFEDDWYGTGRTSRFALVAPTPVLVAEAARLCENHGLKGFDAVQLASALTLGPDAVTFVSFDRTLNRAAQAEGLTVLAPTR
jgi:hypothetical protein